MRKILLLVIIATLFLINYSVFAEECKTNNIGIESINVKEKSKYTEELANPTLENNKLKLNLKMYDVGDYINYEIKIKNNSNEVYYFDENSINNNSNYFIYSLSYKDGSNRIEPNKSKIIYLKVEYKNEVEKQKFFSGKYNDNGIVSINLVDRKPILNNPLTKSNNIIMFILFLILLTVILFKCNNKKATTYILLLFLSLFVPITTYALCKANIDIESNIIVGKVKPNPCTYNGELVPGAEYVNGQYTYRYMQEYDYNYASNKVDWVAINKDGWGVILTNKDSSNPVTTKLCTSINDKPIVSMSYMFAGSKTTSIDLSSFDTSNVYNMQVMFSGVTNVEEYDLSSFDTSNVYNMPAMFIGNSLVKKYDLHGFDTSKVKDMGCMFCSNSSLKEIDLSTFNTSSLESAQALFSSSNNLEKVIMDNWNIRNSSVLGGAFSGTNIKTLSLKNWKIPENFTHSLGCRATSLCTKNIETIDVTGWDLSKTKNVEGLFANSYVKEIIGLNTWDTSNITNMDGMFQFDYNLTELDLSSFDTRNVTSTRWMFMDDSKLKTIKASDNFKLDHVTIENSDTMFQNCTSLVGGNGTLYNGNHLDKEYARIDNPGIPGYFTKK